MKKKILMIASACALVSCLAFTACSAKGNGYHWSNSGLIYDFAASEDGNYQYGSITESPFTDVSDSSASYFSLDRNTACYSYVRYQIDNDMSVRPDSVRVE